ncbi:MAG: TlyA family RNA methyltransferase [Synergistaceae bacterium]|jgi:23S rRNA (cytidine1920-2'-O)/16S rRNA (cytidine1409-2'-O)-methyltransferase|nr:TlyA family RNA methyltransferase [Synergistaceae bacterium]
MVSHTDDPRNIPKKSKIAKERLDKLLVDRKFVESRTKAQALIMAGKVKVDGERVEKAGAPTAVDCVLEVDQGPRWVSRGAFKLLKALDVFEIDASGRVCVDIGASTGGFTDVLLNAGAKKIYAVDVGYGQLHSRLAADPRVLIMDRTNARFLTPDRFDQRIELLVCDASFISLRLLLPAMDAILFQEPENPEKEKGDIVPLNAVLLIKPQFEAGRERLGRGGVVRDPKVHVAVVEEVLDFVVRETRLCPAGLSWSPVLGPEGNLEFLCHLIRAAPNIDVNIDASFDINAVIDAAHQELLRKE